MHTQAPATREALGYTYFLPGAVAAVTRAFWHRPRRRSGFVLFGGILFWIFVWYAVVAWYLAKVVAWLAVIVALMLAQGGWLIIDTPFVVWQRVTGRPFP